MPLLDYECPAAERRVVALQLDYPGFARCPLVSPKAGCSCEGSEGSEGKDGHEGHEGCESYQGNEIHEGHEEETMSIETHSGFEDSKGEAIEKG